MEEQDNAAIVNAPESKFPKMLQFVVVIVLLLTVITGSVYAYFKLRNKALGVPGGAGGEVISQDFKLEKFKSDQDFADFFKQSGNNFYAAGFGSGAATRELAAPTDLNVTPQMGSALKAIEEGSSSRTSQTNVQVAGIDEPDIVKTDGKNIFYSNPNVIFYGEPGIVEPLIMEDFSPVSSKIMPPPNRNYGGTKVINALPPQDMAELGNIDEFGGLLVVNNKLIIFSGNKIVAYDVADPSSPSKSWEYELENNQNIVTSRLYNDKIYVVTNTYANRVPPCPLPVLSGSSSLTIACTDIYHPTIQTGSNSVYTAFILTIDGKVQDSLSYVGSSGQSVVYMSTNNLYVTYPFSPDLVAFVYGFAKENKDLFGEEVVAKLERLMTYDISSQAKFAELSIILQNLFTSKGSDDRAKFESELTDRMTDYSKAHARELQRTGIVKIALDNFKIQATGNVAGGLLNQFSLDEWNGHLRVATTTNSNSFIFPVSESFNDLYILDSKLDMTGKILDLGLTEQIYSARFIGDKGYLVTFRRTDPFYVFDLSNPKNPVKAGELKIPGYSSYLDPLTDNIILGVGEENNKVKLSLFDVRNPQNPTEVDKYNMDEYWTEVNNNHHAFLKDEKHEVFFLPAGKGGYIFSYKNNKLELLKVATATNVQRALYLNDFLYIVGSENITVLDENNWNTISELSL